MKPLCPEALNYLSDKRVGVLAVEMRDGAPHAATVHFCHVGEEPVFIFETSRHYRKAEPILEGGEVRASFVVGFTEGPTEKTLQFDGTVRLLTEEDAHLRAAYLAKFPEKEAKAADPDNIFFRFVPTWWRFTDWGAPGGKTIYLSDEV